MSDKIADLANKYGFEPRATTANGLDIGVNHAAFYIGVTTGDLLRAVRLGFSYDASHTPDFVHVNTNTGVAKSTPISFFTDTDSQDLGYMSQKNLDILARYANAGCFSITPNINSEDFVRCFDGFEKRIKTMTDAGTRPSQIWKPL